VTGVQTCALPIYKAEGVNALKAFCDAAGLPRPYLVDSGRGVHAYWPLTADITKQQWKPVADRLKVVCHEHGLDADPARTADVASILRVPETFNFKEDPPLNVAVILPAPATDFETFKAALGGSLDEIPDYAAGQINELTRALLCNKQHRFSRIMLKIEKGNGCNQLEDAIKNRETLEEPRWRAALSIPAFCVDSATGIHEVSLGHPDYSPEGTQQKITKIRGPYTCEAFERINPGGCAGCPNLGKINSPITLVP